jgi:hypothetical protein
LFSQLGVERAEHVYVQGGVLQLLVGQGPGPIGRLQVLVEGPAQLALNHAAQAVEAPAPAAAVQQLGEEHGVLNRARLKAQRRQESQVKGQVVADDGLLGERLPERAGVNAGQVHNPGVLVGPNR